MVWLFFYYTGFLPVYQQAGITWEFFFSGERQGEYHEWMNEWTNEWMNEWKKKILSVFQKSASKDTSDMIHQKVHVVPKNRQILCPPLSPSNPDFFFFFSSNLV